MFSAAGKVTLVVVAGKLPMALGVVVPVRPVSFHCALGRLRLPRVTGSC
ncbi:hypothetical protein SAVIM40S_03261 [Streptomyces avidinii]